MLERDMKRDVDAIIIGGEGNFLLIPCQGQRTEMGRNGSVCLARHTRTSVMEATLTVVSDLSL